MEFDCETGTVELPPHPTSHASVTSKAIERRMRVLLFSDEQMNAETVPAIVPSRCRPETGRSPEIHYLVVAELIGGLGVNPSPADKATRTPSDGTDATVVSLASRNESTDPRRSS